MKKNEINILVVDDDKTFLASLCEAINRLGYKATGTNKVDEALNLVRIKPFNAAIVDCMLPRMNGVDLSVELRKSRFASAPIILMSGIFKDKSFAVDSVEKTKAVVFLNKPFHMADLKTLLDNQFKELLSLDEVPLQVLISKPFSSARERTRVIEGLEEIKGYDLPFVLCVLMDANAGGHLNIANNNGEVFGITLNQGKIVKVDSSESLATLSILLIEKGFVTGDDLKTVSGKRGELTANLVEQQFISPHVLPLILKEQILTDLQRLFVDEVMKINFVPDRIKDQAIGLNLDDITPLLHQVVANVIPDNYLKGFYEEWMDYPVQVGPHFEKGNEIFKMSMFKSLENLRETLSQQLTIHEVQQQGKFELINLLKALHLLVFRPIIVFDDVKKAQNVAEYGDRMKGMLKDLEGKNPFQIFKYFGASEVVKEHEASVIYKEFSRSNHPDLLPPKTPADLRKVVNTVFSIVSDAHDVLIHPERRGKLLHEMRQKEAEIQIRAENLADDAINMLRRGRNAEALVRTKEAFGMYPSRSVKLAHAWALLKASEGTDSSVAGQVNKILESFPHEERPTTQFQFVAGLLKRALGDYNGAVTHFDKAIAMDPNFLEARRERGATEAPVRTDSFNADLTKLVGNFFKKKR